MSMMILPLFILNIENDDDRNFVANMYTNNYKLMYYIAMKYTQNPIDTEDVISETCLKLMKRIELLRKLDADSLSAYINVATTNTVRSFLKRKNKEILDDGELTRNLSHDEEPPDVAILRLCTIDEVKEALGKISEIDQMALKMKYMLEYSDEEIAKELGIQKNSVRMRLKRARDRLYEKIDI